MLGFKFSRTSQKMLVFSLSNLQFWRKSRKILVPIWFPSRVHPLANRNQLQTVVASSVTFSVAFTVLFSGRRFAECDFASERNKGTKLSNQGTHRNS